MRKIVVIVILLTCLSLNVAKLTVIVNAKGINNAERSMTDRKIKSSKNDVDYSNNGKVDIAIGSQKQTLFVTKKELRASDDRNKPIQVTLTIGKNKLSFESLWNDGVLVRVADFDQNDQTMDIYITELGTDIGATTYIFKFDGLKLYLYGQFQHFLKDFCYDGQGKIYCWYNDDQKVEFNTVFDYRAKQSRPMTDLSLKEKINRLFTVN